jgi:hypothetical protein
MRCSLIPMHLRLMLAGAVAAVLATAAPASAADNPVLDKRCYVAVRPDLREPVGLKASGFMPGALVDVFVDDVLQPVPPGSSPPTADPAGVVDGFVLAPFVVSNQRRFTLRVTERAHPMTTFATVSKVTALSVTQSPRSAATSRRVRFRGRGFTGPTGPVYAHYVFAGLVRRTVRVAKPYGDCGLFSVRMRQFPFKQNPHRGVWTIQFDQYADYNPHAPVFTTLKITVKAKIKPRR